MMIIMMMIMKLTHQASSKYVSGRFHSPLHGHNNNAVHRHFHPYTSRNVLVKLAKLIIINCILNLVIDMAVALKMTIMSL